ncbi:putative repeat protein (TIGR01451 family) [Haloactinopolyspora alba]|uniref:Putative repeat protein (TIGR01451 family) n=1 Tax=Haloactinopolyspora alba TaxID=648780 RepID=A0A2P8EF62_9ACTN|nr:CARDB domain-containing protein [Haloactinopolyspora alba]PSL08074.1 putative repeat protein (TIGR01451 family) [Haloactinopolyspora alba]
MYRTQLYRRLTAGIPFIALVLAGLTTPAAYGDPPGVAEPTATSAVAPMASEVPLDGTVTASGSLPGYPVANSVDGDQASYWESTNDAFPQWLQVDLGAARPVQRVVLKLPAHWEARDQTVAVRGSTDGSSFTDLSDATGRTFSPGRANTVSISFDTTTTRYVRLRVTANTGWPAAQISELEVYGPDTGDTQPPTAPAELTLTEPAEGQIRLEWTASTDDTGVTDYVVYRNNTEVATVAGDVLTYTDSQPGTASVEYFVRARDAAGNESPDSNRVTRGGDGPGTNLAAGKPVDASSSVFSFVAGNAVDGDATSYWESAGFESTLTAHLGADADLDAVVVKLDPDPIWTPRTQTFEILGRAQGSTEFTSLKGPDTYEFDPVTRNTVTIPVTGQVADVRLRFTANTGAPGAQVAELQVMGTPAPNPDLTVTDVTWTPAEPTEASPVTVTATVRNAGTADADPATVNVTVDGAVAGNAEIGALAAGDSATVPVDVDARPAGSYTVAAVADPDDTLAELDEGNNGHTAADPLVIARAPGPDLEIIDIAHSPQNPAVGDPVTFTVTVHNRGTSTAAAAVTRLVVDGTTLDTDTAAVEAGATTTVPISGSWTATRGDATITATADATDAVTEPNEGNNELALPIVVGRGAAVPYVEYEAEAASYDGTLLTADPQRTFGHTNVATESSGRQSVRLNDTGQYVEFTSTNRTNSIVVRNSIPDAPNGGGIEATISLYVNGEFERKLTLSSKHSWLYGDCDGPECLTNTPQADARRLFDESHALLGESYPAGTTFRLQRDGDDTASYYVIDLIDLEQVAPPKSKPAECTSITEYGAIPGDGVDDAAAIQRAVTDDQNGVISCVWIPEGRWRQESKILTDDPQDRGPYNQVGIRDVTVRGAGMWHSQLYSLIQPQNADGINHPHEGNFGFDIDHNTRISDIAIFGSGRIRGGGGAEGGVALNGRFGTGTKITNVWIEHANVGVWVGRDYSNIPELWGPADGVEFSGMRIRNTYADGINFTNGTRNSRVFNSSFRTTGDDSLAVWASRYVKDPAVDIAHDNHFVNNTIQLPWRANGIAIYGGHDNTIENNLVYDTMNYPGIMLATDHDPLPFSGRTLIANNALYRCGGAFWNEQQEFGALTLFAAGGDITGVTIRDTEIHDSTYDGIQFKSGGGATPDVRIADVRIDKSNNGAGILAHGGARGSATLTNVEITDSATGDIVIEPGSSFVIDGG